MKYTFIFAMALLVITGCTTQYQTSNYDDVYYSSKFEPVKKQTLNISPADANQTNQGELTQQEQVTPAEGNYEQDSLTFAENQPYESDSIQGYTLNYNEDDYYDYAYSARLRRFHSPFYFNYYNDYYTNSYWYDYNPWNWGTSIYMGYNWWSSSFFYGYNPWYMSPYGYMSFYDRIRFNNWYGWGYSYWNPFYNEYWNPYYNGYWGNNYADWNAPNNYYNSYDRNSYYYGHRGSVASSGSIARTDNRSFGERYESRIGSLKSSPAGNAIRGSQTISNDRIGNTTNTVRSSSPITNESRGASTRNNALQQTSREGVTTNQAVRGQNSGVEPTDNRGNRTVNYTQRPANSNTQPQRQYQYMSPNRNNQNTNSDRRTNASPERSTQTYTSPEYNRPRSGQEYTSPKYRSTQPSGSEQNNRQVTPSSNYNSQPSNEGRRYSQPGNYNSSPSRSSENYLAPRNNSYSQPTRTNSNTDPARNSSSAPTRNNNDYQAPRNNSYSQPTRTNTYTEPPRNSSPAPAPSRSSESYSAPRQSSNESYSAPRNYSSGSDNSSRSSGSSNSSSGSSNSSSGSNNNSSSGGGRR